MGPRRGLRDRPRRRLLQGLRPDQHCRPTPTSTSAARASRPRPSSRSAPTPTQDLDLVSPPTFTLSGTVTRAARRRSAGRSSTSSTPAPTYIGAATMGPGAAYAIDLAAGTYKAYVQTNTPAYPDQYIGGSSIATATVITVSAATDPGPRPGQPADVHPLGHRQERRDAAQRDVRLHLRRRHRTYIGAATMGPGAAYAIDLAAGTYKAYVQTNTPAYPDQYFGGSSIATATVITVSANTDPGPRPGRPAGELHPLRHRDAAARPPDGTFVHVVLPDGTYIGNTTTAGGGPTRSASPRATTSSTSSPTWPATPTSTIGGSTSPARPSSRSAPTPSRTSPWSARRRVHPLRHRDAAGNPVTTGRSSTSSCPTGPTSGQHDGRPRRAYSIEPRLRATTSSTSSPTWPAYPDQYFGGSTSPPRPSSRSAPTPSRTSPWSGRRRASPSPAP